MKTECFEIDPTADLPQRGVRTLFKTGQIVLQRDIVVPPLGAHQFTIKWVHGLPMFCTGLRLDMCDLQCSVCLIRICCRFRLPQALPPSFRGSSIRFYYTINVKALYEVKRG